MLFRSQSPEPALMLDFQSVNSPMYTVAYLDISHEVPLNSCHAASLVELDLPNPAEVRQEVFDEFASSHVPHLERAVRPRYDLLSVMLKASYCSSMGTKRAFAVSVFGVPDAESAICSSRNKSFMAEV